MDQFNATFRARRELLKFLAASPLFVGLGGVSCLLAEEAFAQNPQQSAGVIANPAEALDVLDFEQAAHLQIPAGHWAYMASGVDDDATLRANREGFKRVQLRPRRLRDGTKVDTRVELFGTTYNSPIFLCPVSGLKAFSSEGELGAARAAKARGTLQCLSTMTSTPPEDVSKELGRPVWQQLYAPNSWTPAKRFSIARRPLDLL